ncbi:MAG: hypothetical protein JWR35_1564 [Marmoricola sp.]|nr:hypothetical protein [Marmoricola sp.]
MTSLFSPRRSAADFASVLDGTADDDVNARFANLVATVGMMRSQETPAARPEFVADLRSRLLVAADAVLISGDAAVTERLSLPRRRMPKPAVRIDHRRERRFGAAIAALVLVGGTAGMAAAAQGALPGSPLYPIKRGIERAEVSFNTSDSAKGSDMLGQANTRLSEVKDLLADSKNASQVSKTLSDFRASAGNGSDLLFTAYKSDGNDKDIAQVRAFTASQMSELQSLRALLPASVSSALAATADLLANIDQQARVLCAGCSSSAPLALPDSLIQLTSSPALRQLLATPVRQIQVADAQEALKNAQKATQAGATATGGGRGLIKIGGKAPTISPTPDPSGSPTTGDGLQSLLPSAVSNAAKPVQDLVRGLTGSTSGLTDTLTTTLGGVTGLLGQ